MVMTGSMVHQRCMMRSATLEYPILLVNSTVYLTPGSRAFTAKVQEVGNGDSYSPTPGQPLDPYVYSYSTIGGIGLAAQNLFNASATQTGGTIGSMGLLASQYIDYGEGNNSFFQTQDACSLNWVDPTSDIIDALNEIMFRTSLLASNYSKYALLANRTQGTPYCFEAMPIHIPPHDSGIPEPQILQMSQVAPVTVFQSNYYYFGGAFAVMALSFLLIIPSLHGLTEFGRNSSLSPLEIAKAFDAPMLRGPGSNFDSKRLTKIYGSKQAQYGEVVFEHESGLKAGWEENSLEDGLGLKERRLGLADPDHVIPPTRKALYF